MISSAVPRFHTLNRQERLEKLLAIGVPKECISFLSSVPDQDFDIADKMVENAIGVFSIPIHLDTKFIVNGQEIQIPLCTKSAQLVSGLELAANFCLGSLTSIASEPIMIGQIQLWECPRAAECEKIVEANRGGIAAQVDELSGSLKKRGGGFRDVQVRQVESPRGMMTVVHVLVNVCDAMGANAINRVCEGIAPFLQSILGGRVGFRILSNLTTDRRVASKAAVPMSFFSEDLPKDALLATLLWHNSDELTCASINNAAAEAVEAVLLATANDTRGASAGIHAFACLDGTCRSVARVSAGEGDFVNIELDMPMAVGVLGGTISTQSRAQHSLAVMGNPNAKAFTEAIGAVALCGVVAHLKAALNSANNTPLAQL